MVTFDGSQSYTADPSVTIVSWTLDFGDGTPPVSGTGRPPSPTATHVYASDFYADAVLTVVDSNGANDAEEVDINIGFIAPPIASLLVEPDFGRAPLDVVFNTSGTEAAAGNTITSYALDFGDGTVQTGAGPPPATIPKTYTAPGFYQAELTVTQTDGETDISAVSVFVIGVEAVIEATPQSGTAPLEVVLDTTGTFVAPGTSITYFEIDFDDGTPLLFGNGPPPATVTHTYLERCRCRPGLYVETSEDSDFDSVLVLVSSPPPTARLTAAPASGPAPLTVTFDGSTSSAPPEVEIEGYSLDFGDGSLPASDEVPPPSPTATHTYTEPGIYTATLTVYGVGCAPVSDGGGSDARLTEPIGGEPGFVDVGVIVPSTECIGTTSVQIVVRPTVTVIKTARPSALPAPGGSFTFDVTVSSPHQTPVVVTALRDDVYGDLNGRGTCATGATLNAADPTYNCSFTGTFTGVQGASQTDVVTATVSTPDGVVGSGSGAATVSLTAPLVLLVDKTALPTTLPEPGGTFTFNVTVTNPNSQALTVTSMNDNVYGGLNGRGTCVVGAIVAANGGNYVCSFPGPFAGNAGASQSDVVTVTATASNGVTATGSDSATVVLSNVAPSLTVTKTATPASQPEPGGSFLFGVTVANTGFEPVTVTALTDDVYGNLAGQGTCATGTVVAPAGTYSCSFTGSFTGPPGAVQTDTVTATVTDDDQASASATAQATVTISNLVPTIAVFKRATPPTRPEPGGAFTFEVTVTNTGPVTATVTALNDDVYGNLNGRGTCAIGDALPPGGAYSCSFAGEFRGNAGASQTDTVTAVAVDPSGDSVSARATATVSLTDVAPRLSVAKTASPTTRAEPGGSFTFTVVVTNTGDEVITLTSLTDNVYGDLNGQGSCATGPGVVLAPGGVAYTCSFPASFTGNAGSVQTDIVTATVTDDEGTSASASASAAVMISNLAPVVTVAKSAVPASRPEPGGTFGFDVSVTNTGAEAVTVTALTDDPYGDLNGRGTCATGAALAPGGMYSCSFNADFTGDAGASQTDTVTVTVLDDDGTTAQASRSATVTIIDVPPSITVTKAATPASRPEPGGTFSFTVVVTNTSFEPVTLTSLTDDVYGDLAGRGTCATGATLAPTSGTYTCTFSVDLRGDAGARQTDTVTATVVDNDDTSASGAATATVGISDVAPTLTVVKTPAPATLPEPGGSSEFTVAVTNTSFEPVRLIGLTDDVYGDLNGRGTCATGVLLGSGAGYTCAFRGSFFGDAGSSQTDTVTATVVDNDGTPGSAVGLATVRITDARPTISLVKRASPLSRPEPGGPFTFTLRLTNASFEPVMLTSLTDDVYGNLNGRGSCTTGLSVAPSATYTCAFSADFTANAGATQTDTVTAVVLDNDGSSASATARATVAITDLPPVVAVDKTATPASRPEPGGDFNFAVVVTNRSVEPVRLTALTDSVYGNLNGRGTCATGATVAAGGVYSCAFTGRLVGEAGASETDTVAVTVVDDDGSSASATDVATVSITDVPPSISVTKTANPPTRAEPGGSFIFTVVVANTSPEPVTLTSLTDDVYGNLNGRGTCVTGVSVASGRSYTCFFSGDFTGNARATQTDTVAATVVDNDGSSVTEVASATVVLTDVPPTLTVDKTAVTASLPEPGGTANFNATVTNTSSERVTLTALADDVYGDLNGRGTCATGVVLAPGAAYSCAFSGSVFGDAGATPVDTVTATVVDDDGTTASAGDVASVRITDVPPSVRVSKQPVNPTIAVPGGTFVFAVTVTNTSFEPVTIESLTDDPPALGNCAAGVTVAPNGGTYTCGFVRDFFGPVGASQTDRVTVTVVDNDGSRATAADDATVSVSAAPPPTTVTSTTAPPTTAPRTTAPSTTAPATTAPPTTAPATTAPPSTTIPPTTAPSTTAPSTTAPPTTAAPSPASVPVATTSPPVVTTAAPVPTTATPVTAAPTTVPATTSTSSGPTTTTPVRPTSTTSVPPPPPGGASLAAVNPEGERSGPPGVGLDVSGGGYAGCRTVYVFFDGVRIGTVTPDAAGFIGVGGLSVPGDADPGPHQVVSSCNASGAPVRAATQFQVTDASLHRSALVTSLAHPRDVSTDLDRLLTSAAVAVALLLLLAFPFELFNSTLEENYDEVRAWFHLPPRVAGAMGGIGGTASFLGLTVLTAVVVGLLSPDFGLNMASLALMAGFTVALLVMSLAFSLPAAIGIHRRTGEWGRLNFLPGSLLVSIVMVALSRLFHFQPGYMYGALAGLAFRSALPGDTQGRLTAANWLFSLTLSVGAWIARVAVSDAAAAPDASLWWIGVEACLALIFLWGVEGLAVAMLPMRFLDGRKVISWNRVVWAGLFFLGLFATVHVLLSPESGYLNHTSSEVTIAVMVLFAVFGALSVGFWAYFRYRPDRWTPSYKRT